MFAKSFIDDMFQVSEIFGPGAVLFLSNDDKARVPLGLSAANLQAPLLMHLSYKVTLPDHDFVVGQRHKLIPSVYSVCNIKEDGQVSYSGDTFIRIRSGKHDSSNAFTHAHDVRDLFTSGSVVKKPILMIETDGAQDEAPRYPKTLATSVSLFKLLELDVLLHGVNAAGLSAFNPCERRMAPLSHDLAGVVLPHDTYGSHLDKQGKTVNEELEKKNFHSAAEALALVWSDTVIDGHAVDAKAVAIGQAFEPPTPDAQWVSRHVQQSRYALQVVKCVDANCCAPFQTNWLAVLPSRFIPPPMVFRFSRAGMVSVEPSEVFKTPKHFQFAPLLKRIILRAEVDGAHLPFDTYCPSMVAKLDDGICPACQHYWPSAAAMKRHKVAHGRVHHAPAAVSLDCQVEDKVTMDVLLEFNPEDCMPIFDNINDLLINPFEDC